VIRGNVIGLFLLLATTGSGADVLAPVPTPTNVVVRVMAANLTGDSQEYEAPQIRILQGLKPDVVAIQEFRYGESTPGEIRAFVDAAFGPEFAWYRENYVANGDIPNGVISRYPIIEGGSWDDPYLNNRGFAWARIDLPGTNDLYVVSVHLKADNSSAAVRANQAASLTNYLSTYFPLSSYIVLAGDLNTQNRAETCLATLTTLLQDDPIPTDAESGGDPDTNEPRSRPYDYVLPSPTLAAKQVPTRVGDRRFPNGLVFDSRVYTPLADVAPVLAGDSAACQHMAVLKDFRIDFAVTNFVTVTSPTLVLLATNRIAWTGPSNLTYTVEAAAWLTNWGTVGTATSPTTNFSFTFPASGTNQQFYRVIFR
jgi:endonuclease/exonuclease/phosphatase family metal-dependent hydrolase